jgi:hypothetical protein
VRGGMPPPFLSPVLVGDERSVLPLLWPSGQSS